MLFKLLFLTKCLSVPSIENTNSEIDNVIMIFSTPDHTEALGNCNICNLDSNVLSSDDKDIKKESGKENDICNLEYNVLTRDDKDKDNDIDKESDSENGNSINEKTTVCCPNPSCAKIFHFKCISERMSLKKDTICPFCNSNWYNLIIRHLSRSCSKISRSDFSYLSKISGIFKLFNRLDKSNKYKFCLSQDYVLTDRDLRVIKGIIQLCKPDKFLYDYQKIRSCLIMSPRELIAFNGRNESLLSVVKDMNFRNEGLMEALPFIKDAKNLKKLRYDSNCIRDIGELFETLNSIETLYLDNNAITDFPNKIQSPNKLKILDLSRNSISEIPDSIGNLEDLECLYLSFNSVNKISPAISSLKNLRYLIIEYTLISEAQEIDGGISSLKAAALGNNNLNKIPKFILKSENLEDLILDGNKNIKFNHEILQMKSLKKISLNSCDLESLSPFIFKLENLESLNILENGKVTSFPREMLDAKHLETVNVSNANLDWIGEGDKIGLLEIQSFSDINICGIQGTWPEDFYRRLNSGMPRWNVKILGQFKDTINASDADALEIWNEFFLKYFGSKISQEKNLEFDLITARSRIQLYLEGIFQKRDFSCDNEIFIMYRQYLKEFISLINFVFKGLESLKETELENEILRSILNFSDSLVKPPEQQIMCLIEIYTNLETRFKPRVEDVIINSIIILKKYVFFMAFSMRDDQDSKENLKHWLGIIGDDLGIITDLNENTDNKSDESKLRNSIIGDLESLDENENTDNKSVESKVRNSIIEGLESLEEVKELEGDDLGGNPDDTVEISNVMDDSEVEKDSPGKDESMEYFLNKFSTLYVSKRISEILNRDKRLVNEAFTILYADDLVSDEKFLFYEKFKTKIPIKVTEFGVNSILKRLGLIIKS